MADRGRMMSCSMFYVMSEVGQLCALKRVDKGCLVKNRLEDFVGYFEKSKPG